MKLQGSSVVSTITTSLPAPTSDDTTRTPFILDIRSLSAVDLNDDGFLDIFIHPSYFNSRPSLAPVALLNDAKGGFYDGTSTVFQTSPVIHQSNGVFFKDFNGDGKTDLFVVDQGLEVGDAYNGGFPGASNHLYLSSANASFQDATTGIQNNEASFNHISSVVDMNGDGNLDVLVTRLGGPRFEGSGTFFYLGDGDGEFGFSTSGLPDSIRYKTNSEFDWNSQTIDYQFSGAAGAGDFDGDGRQDLVTGSYTGGDSLTNQQTVRFFQQQATGDFIQRSRYEAPAALKSIASNLGVAGIVSGDLNGDGLQDVAVFWEGGVGGVQILKNLGNFNFADVTEDWLGSYLARSDGRDSTGNVVELYGGISLADINRDGNLDLLLKSMGSSASQTVGGLVTGAFAYLNDGSGHFSPDIPSTPEQNLSAGQLYTLAGTNDWDLGAPMVFDANNDGKSDYVFVSASMRPEQRSGSTDSYALHVASLFGADTSNEYRANDLGDSLLASDGNDMIYAGKGNDVIAGGSGIDTVTFGAGRSSYAVTKSASGYTVKGSTGIDGIDVLSGVEMLQFADQSIDLAQMDRLYKYFVAYYGRAPASAGLYYWLDMLGGSFHRDEAQLVWNFGNKQQTEFANLYGSASTVQDFVTRVFNNLFNRTPAQSGLDYWQGVYTQFKNQGLDDDAIRGKMVTWIMDGASDTGSHQDLSTLNNKVLAGSAFTSAVDTPTELTGYRDPNNTAALNYARDWLHAVTGDSATLASHTDNAAVDQAIAALVGLYNQ